MQDILVRAAKTFVQAFLGVVLAGLATATDFTSAKALVIAAGAAGISAVWNSILHARDLRS